MWVCHRRHLQWRVEGGVCHSHTCVGGAEAVGWREPVCGQPGGGGGGVGSLRGRVGARLGCGGEGWQCGKAQLHGGPACLDGGGKRVTHQCPAP